MYNRKGELCMPVRERLIRLYLHIQGLREDGTQSSSVASISDLRIRFARCHEVRLRVACRLGGRAASHRWGAGHVVSVERCYSGQSQRDRNSSPSRDRVREVEVLDRTLQNLTCRLAPLVLVGQLHLAEAGHGARLDAVILPQHGTDILHSVA